MYPLDPFLILSSCYSDIPVAIAGCGTHPEMSTNANYLMKRLFYFSCRKCPKAYDEPSFINLLSRREIQTTAFHAEMFHTQEKGTTRRCCRYLSSTSPVVRSDMEIAPSRTIIHLANPSRRKRRIPPPRDL